MGTCGTQIDLASPLVQRVDLCFTMGFATGSMLVNSSRVVMAGSMEEVDTKDVCEVNGKRATGNVRVGVRDRAVSLIRNSKLKRFFLLLRLFATFATFSQ